MKSYGYKLINYVFSVAVYNLLPPLDQFVNAIWPKILRSSTMACPHHQNYASASVWFCCCALPQSQKLFCFYTLKLKLNWS